MHKDYEFTGEELCLTSTRFESDVNALSNKGFRVTADLRVSDNSSQVSVDTRDGKIIKALDQIIAEATLLEYIRINEMFIQLQGGNIMMSNGISRWPKPQVTFDQIDQDVQTMKEKIFQEVLGNGSLAVLASSVRSVFGR